MKERLRMFKRSSGVFYWEDAVTRKQGSLQTRDRLEAVKMLQGMREALQAPDQVNLALAQLHLRAANPDLAERTWGDLLNFWVSQGQAASTRERRQRMVERLWMRDLARYRLSDPEAVNWIVMHLKGNSDKEGIRGIQRLGVCLGWVVAPPVPEIHLKVRKKDRRVTRAITLKEHESILEFERESIRLCRPNAVLGAERAKFYEMLWFTGAAQTDGATLTASNIEWERGRLRFRRHKTGEQCLIGIGSVFEAYLRRLPSEGQLFPRMAVLDAKHRAAEFARRRKLLEMEGISLHSYRYAWAERAAVAGIPLRWAQAALGHSSQVVANAYARKVEIACPAPEDYRDEPDILAGDLRAMG